MRPDRWPLRDVLRPVDPFLGVMGRHYGAFMWAVKNLPPQIGTDAGRWRAVRAAFEARRRVPAYRQFLADAGVTDADVEALRLPETDKDNYIRRFSIDERCVGGSLPTKRVAIDESSGSTGTPYNWVRSLEERSTSHTFVSHFARYCFGEEPFITINAFSMGAWATGVNMGIALQRNGVVKNTGPEIDKILHTLDFLGSHRKYLICGYPPFLKFLIDTAAQRSFPLEKYRLMGLVGGEGMSEGLRDYLSARFQPVHSGFGATDLEIGIAGETPATVAIRQAAREDSELRTALFGDDPRLPMLFHYNPLSHYVEVNHLGELVLTVCRLELLSPRIRYNVHDAGGVATFAELGARIRSAGRDPAEFFEAAPVRLPFLWIYGRKDSTVSVMGANIYPEDVEQALYDEPELAAVTNSFCIGLVDEPDGGVRPSFSFEVRVGINEALRASFAERITERIRRSNADFRTALEEHRASVFPDVHLYSLCTGPFAGDANRIKQARTIKVPVR